MGENSAIEWTDHTASPWYGCSHAVLSDGSEHEGCANCYAEALAKRNPAILGQWGTEGTRVLSKSFSKNCDTWNKQAERDGVRRSVFPSLCDPFESVEAWDGPLNSWRAGLFSVIDNCPWLDFLLLTKRPQNVRKMWPDYSYHACITGDCPHWSASDCDKNTKYRENVWLLASVSNQRTADEMIPELLGCRDLVSVLGLSMEPLLGPIDLTNLRGSTYEWRDALNGIHVTYSSQQKCDTIDWVIVGGESGHNARPMHPDWVRSIRDQCQAAGVPFFFKQWGRWAPFVNEDHYTHCGEEKRAHAWIDSRDGHGGLAWIVDDDGHWSNWTGSPDVDSHGRVLDTVAVMGDHGKKAAGRELDGRTWDEFPKAGTP